MSEILLAATPLDGHVIPVVGVGCALRDRGHRVRVLTGGAFRGLVNAHGLEFRELPGAARAPTSADRLPLWYWGRRPRLPWSRGVKDVIEHFIKPIGVQHDALAAAMANSRVDAIVCDTGFLGTIPWLLGSRRSDRPPIIGLSVTPISLPSVDAAPFGSALQPGPGPRYVRRNRRIRVLLDRGPLRPLHRATDDALRGYGVAPGSFDYFAQVAAFDATLHLGLPELEYPRSELPDRVRLVGPLRPLAEPDQTLPDWWPELAAGSRPVVHVTQGTLENRDGRRLLVPAIRALADSEVLVVVSTGRRPLHELSAQLESPIPANVRVAEYLPYGRLLKHVDVLVSNGGYGSVQLAVRHGIPVVVAGGTADKPETAARVAWSGAGLDLHSGRPSPRALRRAVERVLKDPRYRNRAASIQAAADARSDPAAAVVAAVEELTQRATTALTDPGE